ncbi:hypothetical protein [uncultured Shewanella sp.]|uniref:hypothetical protein n=1 Tax=uncultured Shewanella sp. TaxID=173975 RepID=UPI002633E4C5|nr:hypothetical protein [uncultured Shewanella sp.]
MSKDLAIIQKTIDIFSRKNHKESKIKVNNPAYVDILVDKANLYSKASITSKIVTTTTKAISYQVIDKKEGWYAVKLNAIYFGKKFAWIESSDVLPSNILSNITKLSTQSSELLYKNLILLLIDFEHKYKDNPYLTPSGFTINIEESPSISVTFEFNE